MGYRLSRSGLAIAYNQQVEFQGPIVQNIDYYVGSKTINITYTAVSNIDLRNPNGFEICCQGSKCANDSLWTPITISSRFRLTITLSIPIHVLDNSYMVFGTSGAKRRVRLNKQRSIASQTLIYLHHRI